MATPLVTVQMQGSVGVVSMARADKLNAVNQEMADGLAEALASLDANPAVKAIVVTGIDKAFAAGWDVPSYSNRPALALGVGKPVVAAVSGYCVGSGMEMLLNSDIAVAADNAVFAAPEITIGEVDGRVAAPLIKAVGRAAAMDMLMTGRLMPAAEALSRGLVSRVVQAPNLMREAVSAAERLASMPQEALKAIKSLDKR